MSSINPDRSSDHEYLSQFVFKFNNAQMEKDIQNQNIIV